MHLAHAEDTDLTEAVRTLGLAEALRLAREHQPALRRARADTTVSEARALGARASLLPQVSGVASYLHTTGNFVPRPGQVPRAVSAGARPDRDPFELYNFFNFGLTATQLIYDFGASTSNYEAGRELLLAERDGEQATARNVAWRVRSAFLEARALQELVRVAREDLANQERHLSQTQTFVSAGLRPEVDLAQLRTDVANARVRLTEAENAFAIGMAALERAMGVAPEGHYVLADEDLPSLPEEDKPLSQLLEIALNARPDYRALTHRARAQEKYARASRGGFGPALSATTTISAGGTRIDDLVANWNAGVVLSWALLQGGATRARELEAKGLSRGLLADRDALTQDIRYELEQARLGVRAAKEIERAAEEALVSAGERMRLAEKRYAAGLGTAIELGDAQLALTSARAQRVHAAYKLSAARAALLTALGKDD